MSELFAADRLKKCYGAKTVLHEINLSVGPGHCVALLGHNGAGKTTLMKILLGLTAPTEGKALLFGEDPQGRRGGEVRRSVGYLPENVALPQGMTGRELMRFYARLKRAELAQCDELLGQVGLAEAARQLVRTYSKGMRQRLGLAQTLLGQPRLLFLDEPTNGLDPHLRRHFYEVVQGLTDGGATVLVSSHVLTEIESKADLIAILCEGRLAAFGPLAALREASQLPYHLRLTVEPGATGEIAEEIGGTFSLKGVEAGVMNFVCGGQDKMAILRRVAALNGVVHDVDVVPPRLDEIYAHFVGEVRPS